MVKRTGDGAIVEFRSVVDAVRCAIEVQNGMVERNGGLPPSDALSSVIGIHLGDVVEEGDGDLMGMASTSPRIAKALPQPEPFVHRRRRSAGEGAARSSCKRSGADPTQEHRGPCAGLLAGSRRVGHDETDTHVAAKQRSMFVWAGAGIVALAVILGGAWFFLGPHRTASVAPNVPTVAKAGHLSIVVEAGPSVPPVIVEGLRKAGLAEE